MSALDPTAAALLAAVNAADTAFLETVLDLGVSAQVLQAQISVGDLLPALVLKPQNGTDAIELAGKRVAAQLPPDVRPGQTLVLQVMAFDGNRIVVRNLGTVDPQNAPPPLLLTPPPSAAASSTAPRANSGTSATPPPPAPAREIFVAASVRPASATALSESTSADVRAAATAARPVPQTSAVASPAAVLDARIAAAQTSRGPAVTLQTASPPAAQTIASASKAPPSLGRNAVAPPITATAQATRTTSDVLRAARLPDTAFTRTVAAVAHQAPQRLAQVFARLDQVLARVSGDPRAATLRTLAAFTGTLNLANVETLPAQIGAYVSHVVEGAESKLVALLQAYRATSQEHAQVSSPPLHTNTPQHGRIAQGTGELEHDLKTLILSLVKEPPAQRSPALAQALNESLITVTATQLNVLNANQGESAAITLPLPAFFYEGGKPAYLRINRDAGSGAHPMSADNFHIAFILDTKHLGTVAVDLQTSSRTVKVDVKAEHSRAASAFSGTLSSLKDRLESLRYRVSAVTANVAPKTGAAPKKERPLAQLDLHA